MTEFPIRVENVEPSATVEISNIARSLEADGTDVIDLSAGDPDFDTPSHIREYATEKLNQGKTHYTASPGIPELRERIASKLRDENDIETTSETVIVTPGAKQAVFESLFALIRRGDEVILPQPAWVSYEPLIRMCDGTVTPVQLAPQEDFGISLGRFSDAITDETRAIILNTPSNPTGAVYSKSELGAIRDLAVDHDVYVIADMKNSSTKANTSRSGVWRGWEKGRSRSMDFQNHMR